MIAISDGYTRNSANVDTGLLLLMLLLFICLVEDDVCVVMTVCVKMIGNLDE